MATTIGTSWTLIGTSQRYYVGEAQGYLRLYAKVNSQDPIAKTTNYSVLLNLVVDVGWFGNYQTTPWSVSADGISNSGDIGSGSHQSRDLGTATGSVSHGANGAKTISASGALNLTAWGRVLTVSGSGELPSLDVAAPTVTFQVDQSNVNSIKITANASTNCDSWDYSTNGGSSWVNFSTANTTSVSGTITGLTVNTTYPIKVRARRTYNYVYGASDSQNVKTLGIATGSDITAIIGDTVNISWTRYVSSFVHTVRYEFGTKSGTIGTELVDSVNWIIPMNLLYEMTTSSSKIGKYWIDTYDGNTLVGSNEYKLTLQTPDIAKPDFSIALSDAGQASISGVFIKGFSKICATIISDNFSDLYGATITKVKLKVGNLPEKSINYDPNDLPFSIISDTIQQGNVGVNILVTVVDSRGNEKTVATTSFVYAFEKPGIKDISFRISEGQCVIDIYGIISRLTVNGTDYNQGYISVYGRPISSASRYVVAENYPIISTDFYDPHTGEFHITITDDTPGAALITSESYEYSVQIEDYIYTGSLKIEEYVEQTGVVCISRRAGGKGVAFFKEADKDGFDVGCDINTVWFDDVSLGDIINDITSNKVSKTGDTMTGDLTVPTVHGNLDGIASKADYDISNNALIGDVRYYTTAGASGYIMLTFNREESWMYSFTLRLYQGYKATDILISGYNYGANYWYSPSAVIIGDSSPNSSTTIYFGYTGAYKLYVAVPAGNYTGATIVGLNGGYNSPELRGAITISRVSSLPGSIQATVTTKTDIIVDQVVPANASSWGYRKWLSGTSEAWLEGYSLGTMALNQAYGYGYYRATSSLGLPAVFAAAPEITITTLSGNGLISTSLNAISASSFSMYVFSTNSASYPITIRVRATGRWK